VLAGLQLERHGGMTVGHAFAVGALLGTHERRRFSDEPQRPANVLASLRALGRHGLADEDRGG